MVEHQCFYLLLLYKKCSHLRDAVIVSLFPLCFSKLRAKLGLKPLQVEDGANKENGTTLLYLCAMLRIYIVNFHGM